MRVDGDSLDFATSYRLLSGSIVPRAIAWVLTGTEPGALNLAPFSTFTWVSPYPPLIGFNVTPNDRQKDTERNIRADGEYVVHIANETLRDHLAASSRPYPVDVSEVTELGLRTTASTHVKVPRLVDAPIAMECRVEHMLSFGRVGTHFVIGEVLAFHIDDAVMMNGRIETELLKPLARLAGPNFGSVRRLTGL